MKKYTLSLLMIVSLAACSQQSAPPPGAEPAPAATTTQAPPPAKMADQPNNPPPPQSAQEMTDSKLKQVLAGSWRDEANKARDQYRHPEQTLEFFGLKPDMSVIEITPGGGWYTQILAPLTKGSGSYTAAVAKSSNPNGESSRSLKRLKEMFASDPAEYGEARIVEFDPKAPEFGAPGSADMVLTFRNVHNWAAAGTATAMFKGFFDVLKPGGVLGVVDHHATPGADEKKVEKSGYLPKDYVVKLATDAGFKLTGESDINANPKDNHDHPKGVWTLPPTLALGDKDKAKYEAIGESDRMTLRFVKPAAHSGAPASSDDQKSDSN